MPATPAQLANLKKFINQGEVYFGVQKPADSTAMTLTAGVPNAAAGGLAKSVGLTSGPASLQYKPDIKGIEVEQVLGESAPRLMKEAVDLKFKCAEAVFANIQAAVPAATLLANAGTGFIANPTVAPTPAQAAGSSAFTSGQIIWVGYTWKNASGETLLSPLASITIATTANQITATGPALGAGASGTNWYISPSNNSQAVLFSSTAGTSSMGATTAFATGAAATTTNTTNSTPMSNSLLVGGLSAPPTQCIALVSKLGTVTLASVPITIYEWVCIYEGICQDGVKVDWKRAETRLIEVTIHGYADPTRSDGDQLYQHGQLSAA